MKQYTIELKLKKHQIKNTSDRQFQNLYKRAEIQQMKELKNKIFTKILNKRVINKTLVSLIIFQNLSF